MKVKIICVWKSQYINVKKNWTLAPLTPHHLAALFPPDVEVSIHNEQIRPVDYNIDADLVAITYLTLSACRAYEIADQFRLRKTPVVMGGFHASAFPEEALLHADAVVVGEAEYVIQELVDDFKRKSLKKIYKSTIQHDLKGLPTPRYDLIEKEFVLPHTIQATRGCPYRCSFCSIITFNDGFRVRPIDDVVRDITSFEGRNYIQNKVLSFTDNNLIGNKKYAKELFQKITPLKKWWTSQLSLDMAYDKELMMLAAKSGCVSVFIGIESFSQESLKSVKKHHNKIADYKKAIKAFHDYGIYVTAGVIVGFDEDTKDSIRKIPEIVLELGIDLPFVVILTPNYGTELYTQFSQENRIISEDWSRYNTFTAVYRPKNMSAEELNIAFLEMWRDTHSVSKTLKRICSNSLKWNSSGFLWRFIDNSFIMSQNLLGKYPIIRSE